MPKPRHTIEQLKASGSYRKDRHGEREKCGVTFGGEPEMPTDFTQAERKCWDELVPKLIAAGIATQADTFNLSAACRLLVMHRQWMKRSRSSKLSFNDRIRAARVGLACSEAFGRIASNYGLDPQSRMKLKVEPPAELDGDPLVLMFDEQPNGGA